MRIITYGEMRLHLACDLGGPEAQRFMGIPQDACGRGDIDTASAIAVELVMRGGYRNKLKKYGLFAPEYDLGEEEDDEFGSKSRPLTRLVSTDFSRRLTSDVGDLIRKEQKRAFQTLRFFGRELIDKMAKILVSKKNKIMLQRELDGLLAPKLSEFRRLHGVSELNA